ncbi:MAG: c-type cytochrome, partial [Woeseiaceae bacterium]
TRLMAFALDGSADMPPPPTVPRALPELPELRADAAALEEGASLYATNCYACHGKYAAARYGSSVPDLRYATAETHAVWHAIVIGGARRLQGMPAFPLESGQSEAIRDYVLSRARALRVERGGN